MHIFHKRPLSLVLCIMLGGFVLYTNTDANLAPFLFIIPVLILFLPLFFRSKRILCIISAIGLGLAMLMSELYFGLWFDAGERFTGEVTVEARIDDISYDDPYNALRITTDNVDGKPLTRYVFTMSLPREKSDHLSAGDVIRFRGTVTSVYEVCTEDVWRSLTAQGISGFAEAPYGVELLSVGGETFSSRCAQLRENIRRHAVMCSDDETGTLIAALLLGERDYLSPRLILDFRRIGLSHVLALSGMHLAILALAISRILSLFGIGRRISTLVTMLFSIAYMALTGFPISVVRAAVMLIVASILTLLSRTRDPLTSLSISVFLILLVTPYACYDVSLWLSALATLGLVSYTSRHERKEAKPRETYAPGRSRGAMRAVLRILTKLTVVTVTSVLAIGSTLLVVSTFFESVSVLSPITTFIFSPLIELIMYLGMLLLLFGSFIPIGAITAPLVRFTERLASSISSVDNIYVSTDYFAAELAILIFTVLLFLFLVLNIRHKKAALAVLCVSLLSVFAITYTVNYEVTSREFTVLYADPTSTKMIVENGSDSILISSGLHSENSAYASVEMLSISHLSELDAFYVTHYSYALPEELGIILSYVTVDRIYLPAPENRAERDLELLATDVIGQFDTEIVFYNTVGVISVGDISIDPIYRVIYGEGSVKCAFSLTRNGHRTLYLSSGMLDAETYDDVIGELEGSDILIFGMHGRKYTTETSLELRMTPPERIIILSDSLVLRTYDELYYESHGTVVTYRDGETFYEVIFE